MSNIKYMLSIILLSVVSYVKTSTATTEDITTTATFITSADTSFTSHYYDEGSITHMSTSKSADTHPSTLSAQATTAIETSTENSVTTMNSDTSKSITSNTNTMTTGTSNSLYSTHSSVSLDSLTTSNTNTVVTTGTPTTPIININATYDYNILSDSILKGGSVIDSTAKNNVEQLVIESFNLKNFTISVQNITIQNKIARSLEYIMRVIVLFTSARTDCDIDCIDYSKLNKTVYITLPDSNGTLVNVTILGAPIRVQEPPTIINRPKGQSPPGLPAQLGMGLGISLIGILIIAEIIILQRKYGSISGRRRN